LLDDWIKKQSGKDLTDNHKDKSQPENVGVVKIKSQKVKLTNTFSPQYPILLAVGDSFTLLQTVPDKTVKLIITSPPYNIGKNYEKQVELEAYLETQKNIINELVRVLTPDGSICWEVGNYVDKGEIYPLDIYYYRIFKQCGLQLRNRIIWHFNHGLHCSNRFSGRYETILWFTKTEDYTFNLDDIRVPSKYPGKRHYKGPNKGMPSCNPKGKNPSDYWEIVAQDWEREIWEIPNVKSNHPEKTTHPCQFPVELCERCILGLTDENDWVLDPFMGVGSAVIASIIHNRRAMGIDKEQAYVDIAQDRIRSLFDGTLNYRKITKKIYEPTGREKVSKIPHEWKESTS
jgi:adenine-specific DNA-methyltransferase